MNPLRALYSRFRRRLASKRVKVLLIMFDGDLVIAPAHRCQSGWMARWIGNSTAWSLLQPDGTTIGTDLVRAWKPYQGMPHFDQPMDKFGYFCAPEEPLP